MDGFHKRQEEGKANKSNQQKLDRLFFLFYSSAQMGGKPR